MRDLTNWVHQAKNDNPPSIPVITAVSGSVKPLLPKEARSIAWSLTSQTLLRWNGRQWTDVSATSKTVTTSEALSAGNLVNLHNSSGIKCRKASASLGYEAHGFVLEDVGSGSVAMVYTDGENPFLSGLTVGPLFLSSTSGGVTSSVYSTTGYIVQSVGYALSSTKMLFQVGMPVEV